MLQSRKEMFCSKRWKGGLSVYLLKMLSPFCVIIRLKLTCGQQTEHKTTVGRKHTACFNICHLILSLNQVQDLWSKQSRKCQNWPKVADYRKYEPPWTSTDKCVFVTTNTRTLNRYRSAPWLTYVSLNSGFFGVEQIRDGNGHVEQFGFEEPEKPRLVGRVGSALTAMPASLRHFVSQAQVQRPCFQGSLTTSPCFSILRMGTATAFGAAGLCCLWFVALADLLARTMTVLWGLVRVRGLDASVHVFISHRKFGRFVLWMYMWTVRFFSFFQIMDFQVSLYWVLRLVRFAFLQNDMAIQRCPFAQRILPRQEAWAVREHTRFKITRISIRHASHRFLGDHR